MARTTWLLGPVLALALLPSNVVATALPLLREEWAASATEMGWVFAAYQVGYVAAVLLVLPLTDRVPTGRVITACSLAVSLAFLLFPLLAQGVWSAALLRALAGVGLAGVYMPGVRLVAQAATPERRGLAVSVYVSAFYLGAAISLWGTGALLAPIGWRGAALVLGLISVAAAPLAVLATRGAAAPEGKTARPRPEVLRHGPLLRTILAYTGHSWELYVSRGWLAAFLAAVLATEGLGSVEAAAEGGKWAALMAALGTVGVWLGGWLSDRWGRARAALAIAAASGVISLGFGWLGAAGWWLLVVVGCLYGLLVAADSGVYSTAVAELAPSDQLGSAQAAQAFLGFTATALAPVAAGLVLDLGGGYGGAFMLAGVVGLAGAFALVPLARQGRSVEVRTT
ncbi:MAG: MFS transporter [Chloroflexi bacterium]|nr:MFS transporter [Chloroflexota bacterium]